MGLGASGGRRLRRKERPPRDRSGSIRPRTAVWRGAQHTSGEGRSAGPRAGCTARSGTLARASEEIPEPEAHGRAAVAGGSAQLPRDQFGLGGRRGHGPLDGRRPALTFLDERGASGGDFGQGGQPWNRAESRSESSSSAPGSSGRSGPPRRRVARGTILIGVADVDIDRAGAVAARHGGVHGRQPRRRAAPGRRRRGGRRHAARGPRRVGRTGPGVRQARALREAAGDRRRRCETARAPGRGRRADDWPSASTTVSIRRSATRSRIVEGGETRAGSRGSASRSDISPRRSSCEGWHTRRARSRAAAR